MKPKILYIIGDLFQGGIPTFLRNLGTFIEDRFDLHFIATDNRDINSIFKKIGKVYFVPPKLDLLARKIKDINPDIVQYGNKEIYKKAALEAKVPVIVERTAGPRSCNLNREGVTHVITSNYGTVSLVRKLYDGPVTTIYNGVDVGYYKDYAENNKKTSDDFTISYVARIGGVGQGHIDLINAVKSLSGLKIKLFLVGDRPEHSAEDIRSKLKKAAASLGGCCVFLGSQDNPEYWVSRSDLYVCPAHHHGISNSLIEAAALGKPLLATDVGQTKEIVTPKNGMLVKPKSPIGLANGIKYFIQSFDCSGMGRAGQKLVEKEFNIKIQSEKYVRLYRKLINESKHSMQ